MAGPTGGDLEGLWRAHKEHGARETRDQLILHYSPLVKFVAGRMASGLPQSVDQADLVSYGIFGLIDAIDKFEPELGNKFETYAMSRIKGAILDELRSIDWVPRSVRSKARSIEEAYASLEGRLRRTPTDDEVAGELGQTREQFASTLSKISFTGMVALDELLAGASGGDGSTVGDTVADTGQSPGDALEASELRASLAFAIDRLPEREKLVLSLYYYEGLTLASIGHVIGVTESRVCQIHTKAVLQLRSRLAAVVRESA